MWWDIIHCSCNSLVVIQQQNENKTACCIQQQLHLHTRLPVTFQLIGLNINRRAQNLSPGLITLTSSSFYHCNSSDEVFYFFTSRKNTLSSTSYPQRHTTHSGFSLSWLFCFGNLGQKWTNSEWMLQTFLSKRWESHFTLTFDMMA